MNNIAIILVLLAVIVVGGVLFVWYVSDMFTLLRFKIDLVEQQNAELMKRQRKNYEWFIKIARGELHE